MKKADILLALFVVVMLAACARDGEMIVNTSQEVVPTNMPPELHLTYAHSTATTRAGSDIQATQFANGEQVDVFMQDATDNCIIYTKPITYIANGSGRLTYDDPANRLYWPKLLHALEIYGVYPSGSVAEGKKISVGDFNPFTYTTDYSFTVAADQTTEADYKASDLMIGFPSSPSPDVAPCTLYQDGDEGTVNLNFVHRLSKIVVTLEPASNVAEEGSIGQVTADDLAYTGPEDTKYARVTLSSINRKISFKVYDASSDLGTASAADEGPATVISRGSDIAFIVPPQTIPMDTFITINLITKSGNTETVDETFTYALTANLDLAAKNVYTYNITLTKPQVTVTVNDITAWTSAGETTSGNAGLVQPTN